MLFDCITHSKRKNFEIYCKAIFAVLYHLLCYRCCTHKYRRFIWLSIFVLFFHLCRCQDMISPKIRIFTISISKSKSNLLLSESKKKKRRKSLQRYIKVYSWIVGNVPCFYIMWTFKKKCEQDSLLYLLTHVVVLFFQSAVPLSMFYFVTVVKIQ